MLVTSSIFFKGDFDLTHSADRKVLIEKTKVIVRHCRSKQGSNNRPLSYVRFAKELGCFGPKVSYQTIKNWDDGIHAPDVLFLMKMIEQAPANTWQHQFAQSILKIYLA